MRRRDNVFARPLLRCPARFRSAFWAIGAVFLLGVVVLVLADPWPHPGALLTSPGFLALAVLVLLTDLYPLVPWLADVRDDRVLVWSVGLSVAAILAYGPWAALLLPVSGALAGLRRPNSRWWRLALNAGMFGVHGLLSALTFVVVRELLQGPVAGGRPALAPWQLTVAGVAVALVMLLSNSFLLAAASIALGVATLRSLARTWSKRAGTIGTSLLFAPVFAELALHAAQLLPMLAAGILGVHQVETAMHRTIRQARTDPLTGLANRSSLLHNLALMLAAAERSDVTVLVIDLDGFKAINDTHGHIAGDEVLVTLSRRFAQVVPPPDLVARYGGDEFVVVLGAGADGPEVRGVISELSLAVQEPISAGGREVTMSASIGVAVGTGGTSSPLELIARADRAMYRRKTNLGRSLPYPLWTSTGFEIVTGAAAPNLAAAREGPVVGLDNELLGFES